MKFVPYTDPSFRLTGRWDVRSPQSATATATGSYFEFAFEGDLATVVFDVSTNGTPRLHLWVEVDGGDRVEAPVDSYLRVATKTAGVHVCRVIYKGGTESDSRWFAPLHGKITVCGVFVEKTAALPADRRPIIEFVGDSITEGVLVDADYAHGGLPVYDVDMLNRCYQDDVCATYAWLTAEALNLRPVFMGYGAVGVTRAGQGRVVNAVDAYPFNYDGSPVTRPQPDYILINHGANDRPKPVALYLERYGALLQVIRAMNPTAKIVSLSAFCGAFHRELGEFLADYNAAHGDDVLFIDSDGWVPLEPLHPLRDGHKIIAEHLSTLLAPVVGK
jgi:hypothetical protein